MRKIKLGEKYGYLTVVSEPYRNKNKTKVLAQCKCGIVKEYYVENILNGVTTSCGCYHKEILTKHGNSRSQIYKIWSNMKKRCINKKYKFYKDYGGRGIKVCDEWLREDGFINFYNWAMNNGYKEEKSKNGRNLLSIDRIDVNGNYEPLNCRWATNQEQSTNKRLLNSNKSGYVGVSFSNKEKKWVCIISINNKSHRIGSYQTQKQAVEERNKFIELNNLPHKKNIYIGERQYGEILSNINDTVRTKEC